MLKVGDKVKVIGKTVDGSGKELSLLGLFAVLWDIIMMIERD